MRHLLVLLLCCPLFGQAVQSPEIQYGHYAVMLASANPSEVGVMPVVNKEQQIEFVPVSSVAKAINAGASPIHYAELIQFIRQLTEENQRLKTENEKLWAIAGKAAPAAPVVVVQQPQTPAPTPDNEAAERQRMRMMLLRSMLAPGSSTVNVNVRNCTAYPALCVNH